MNEMERNEVDKHLKRIQEYVDHRTTVLLKTMPAKDVQREILSDPHLIGMQNAVKVIMESSTSPTTIFLNNPDQLLVK